MACPGCEVVPTLESNAIRLYLAPKLAQTRATATGQAGQRAKKRRLEAGVFP